MADLPPEAKTELLALAYIRPFGDHYLVSSAGEIWSSLRGGWRKLNPSLNQGYRKSSLKIGGELKNKKISIVVCTVFHGPKPFPDAVVRHLNGVRNDDRADNLAWGTVKENAQDSVRHGTNAGAANGRKSVHLRSGDKSHFSKLTWDIVREIRRCRAEGESLLSLADKFSVHEGTASSICLGKAWLEVGAIITPSFRAPQRPYGTAKRTKAPPVRRLRARASEVAP